jgi:hypothetical protein
MPSRSGAWTGCWRDPLMNVIARLREAGHPFAERYVDILTLELARILA